MATYTKQILNGSVTLTLIPYTLGGRIKYQNNLDAIKDKLPDDIGNIGSYEWQIHANAEICCLFHVLCQGVAIHNDVPDVVMLDDYFKETRDKSIDECWELWIDGITGAVHSALMMSLNVVDERLQAPKPLQAVPKKKTTSVKSS